MYNKSIYCILLYIVTCTKGVWSATPEHDNQNNSVNNNRITGGNDADIETYPYTALLALNDGNQISYCGGSIISRTNIVTSASCLEGVKTIRVRIGSTYSNSGGFEYLTSTFTTHPRYNNNTYDFDVGIVTIQEGMLLDGESSSAIRLPPIADDAKVDEVVTITGWGATEEDGAEPNLVLQMGKVSVISRQECRTHMRGISRRMFCAKGDANICKGDYGGPARGQEHVLNGIASFGPNCGEEGKPGVYTRVGDYLIRTYLRVQTGV